MKKDKPVNQNLKTLSEKQTPAKGDRTGKAKESNPEAMSRAGSVDKIDKEDREEFEARKKASSNAPDEQREEEEEDNFKSRKGNKRY